MFVYCRLVHLGTCDLFLAPFCWCSSGLHQGPLDLHVRHPCILPHWILCMDGHRMSQLHGHIWSSQVINMLKILNPRHVKNLYHVYDYDYDVCCFMIYQDYSRCMYIFIDYSIILDLHNATSIPIMNWIFLDFLMEWSYRDLAGSSRAKKACQVHELVEFSAIIPEQTYTSVLV